MFHVSPNVKEQTMMTDNRNPTHPRKAPLPVTSATPALLHSEGCPTGPAPAPSDCRCAILFLCAGFLLLSTQTSEQTPLSAAINLWKVCYPNMPVVTPISHAPL